MKHTVICVALALVLAAALPAGAPDAFAARANGSGRDTCMISVAAGELLEFSAADLERRMGLAGGSLAGITVTSLPESAQGGLFLDGVEVEAHEYLDRSAIDRLCFAAGESAGATAMELLPQVSGSAQVSLNIRVLETPNSPPTLLGMNIETGRNITAFGALSAVDPDGDDVYLALIRPPEKGALHFEGLSFRYEPYHNQTSGDFFIACAVDIHGNYSAEATVNISIDKQKRDFYYTDMVTNPSQYAALMLHDVGVYTGTRIGTSYFFEPDKLMSRGDFLMLLITSAGLADTMTPTVNSGLPNDDKIPSHLKRYVRQAVEYGLLSPNHAFGWSEIPSRAEAVVLTERAAKISDVKSYSLSMPDLEEIPLWAREAYRDLSAYQMLDLHDGYAHPAKALDNAFAADLTWQLYKHTHR